MERLLAFEAQRATNDGVTALMIAAEIGKSEILDLLAPAEYGLLDKTTIQPWTMRVVMKWGFIYRDMPRVIVTYSVAMHVLLGYHNY